MSDLTATVLPSGRGCRYVTLKPNQVDQIMITAAKELQKDSSFMEMSLIEARLGLESMVKQLTAGECKRVEEEGPRLGQHDIDHPGNVWEAFNPDSYYDSMDPRDYAVLKRVYQELHHVSPQEVAAIMGKAVTVAV